MIQSIVLNGVAWSPFVFDEMYVDGDDHHSLEYWYNAVKKYGEEVNKKIKGR